MTPISPYLASDGPRSRTDMVIVHYTAGSTTRGAIDAMRAAGVSAHVVLDLGGMRYQCLDFGARGRHAGSASWNGSSSVNSRSVGIEIVNLGYLDDNGERYGVEFRTGMVGKRWQTYGSAQIESLIGLLEELCERYDLPAECVIGHEHVAPGRKFDPGPIFPWEYVYRRLSASLPDQADSARASQWERRRILAMQSHLARLGCNPGEVDGLMGRRTREAQVRAWDDFGGRLGWDAADSDDYVSWCRQLVQVPGFDPGRGA